MAVLCARCGAANSDDMSFCVRCGETLTADMKATDQHMAALQRGIAADRTSNLLVQISFFGGALFALLTLLFVSLVKVTTTQLVLLLIIVISLLILAALVVVRLGGGKPPATE
ncbi:MAG: zinc-ribbon domain-containing protein [Thermoplasmata archaeon]